MAENRFRSQAPAVHETFRDNASDKSFISGILMGTGLTTVVAGMLLNSGVMMKELGVPKDVADDIGKTAKNVSVGIGVGTIALGIGLNSTKLKL